MTRALNLMQSPEGAAAGQTAVIRLPTGYTYHSLQIEMDADPVGPAVAVLEANWGTVIDGIRVKVNGDTKIEFASAADLVSLNKYYGHSHDDGVLPIFFGRRTMRTILGEDQSTYKTNGGVSSFVLEIDIKAGTVLGNFKVYAEQDSGFYPKGHQFEGQPMVWGPHYRVQKYAETIGTVGQAEITGIQRGLYTLYAAHLKTSSVSDLEVIQNGQQFVKYSARMRAAFNKLGGRVNQAGFTHVDFDVSNRLSDTLPMAVQDFRLRPTFTAAGAFPIYVESLHGASIVGA